MTDFLPLLIADGGAFLFFLRRSLRYLRFFQQEEYNGARFVAWYRRTLAFDRRGSVICLLAFAGACVFAWLANPVVTLVGWAAFAAVLGGSAWREEDPRRGGKLTLKMTQRARRIWYVAAALFAVVELLAAGPLLLWDRGIAAYWLLLVIPIQAIPFLLMAANALLAPYERRVQNGFRAEAKAILTRIDPLVIGITGSYGKTSTKSVLAAFLETRDPTFWPPGSINTEMGIVRQIREQLKPGHRFAVIEMGAYGIGSISRLCALTPPKVGIVTCVGTAHLERFGSEWAIYQAKSELAKAVPATGLLVCNGDNPGARQMAAEFPKERTILYGLDASQPLDCWMSDIAFSAEGSHFVLHWQGQEHAGVTPLLGAPMLSNLTAAFAAACALGAHPAALIAAARFLQAPPHRLEIKSFGSAVMIDDTYNSNPIGFAAALDVLRQFPGERKLLVTPGMIELGDMQEAENRRLATLAAGICDGVLVVGDTNAQAFTDGLKAGGAKPEQIRFFDHRDHVIAYLRENLKPGDVLLWENDLPDLYEDKPRF